MRWIRWETATPDHPTIAALAEALGVKRAQALGHYNAVCCRMGDHREDGHLADVPNALLEVWALWEGKSGRFTTHFRSLCQDSDGYLKGWWRQAKLKERKDKDRERKRLSAGKDVERSSVSAGKSEEVVAASAGIPRSRATSTSPSRRVEVEPGGEEGVRGRIQWLPELDDALAPYLLPARFPDAILASIRLLLDPEASPHYTAAEVATALRQMQGANVGFKEGTLVAWCARNRTAPPAPRGADNDFANVARQLREESRG